jgi:hypothetical protein
MERWQSLVYCDRFTIGSPMFAHRAVSSNLTRSALSFGGRDMRHDIEIQAYFTTPVKLTASILWGHQ